MRTNISVIPALIAGISLIQAQTLVQDAARLPRRGAAMTVSVVLQKVSLTRGPALAARDIWRWGPLQGGSGSP